jgi:hypothetical protein
VIQGLFKEWKEFEWDEMCLKLQGAIRNCVFAATFCP